jgi:ABC-type dipeptide/oligopeptide/nickel transport system permease subunit
MIGAERAGALVATARRSGALRLVRRPTARIGALIVLVFLLLTITAPVIVPYGPLDQDFLQPLAPPSTAHPLGTDEYGATARAPP